ncbi:hypothetical protein GCM10018954_084430 [Kutzneria kofuensis]
MREYTVKLHMERGSGATHEDVDTAWQKASDGVRDVLNKGYRLPTGDQFPRADRASGGRPGARLRAGRRLDETRQNRWRIEDSPETLAHAVLQFLGPRDDTGVLHGHDAGTALRRATCGRSSGSRRTRPSCRTPGSTTFVRTPTCSAARSGWARMLAAISGWFWAS